jgi:hypothetical protein
MNEVRRMRSQRFWARTHHAKLILGGRGEAHLISYLCSGFEICDQKERMRHRNQEVGFREGGAE